MRSILTLLMALAVLGEARAQTAISLSAAPVPIVEAQINGRPVRLEVDLRLPDILVLNPDAAARLGVRRVPFVAVGVRLDDATIRGRIARPRVVLAGAVSSRTTAGVFNVPASQRADGMIGPGALPYDQIRIDLRPASPGESGIEFALDDADVWRPQARIGGVQVGVLFDLANPVSTFNRTASSQLDELGLIVADGEHAETPMLLGLRAQTQPVRTELTLAWLPLAPAVARTRTPLLGALDAETIVAQADADLPPPTLWVGAQALSACSSIAVDRRSRRLTLTCARPPFN